MREDETLLEYLIRLAKEKGEGLGEGLQQLGVDRLRKARPDAARRQGLMPDQLDIVEDTEVPFPPDRSPVFMPEDITSLMSTQRPTPDRASLEAMITQAGERRPFEEPQPLQEWTGRGAAPEPDPALLQRMLTQPGQTDIAREQWTGVGPLPGEAQSLMDLDQSMTGMREQPAQQDLRSPLTSRMPAADLDLSPVPSVPGAGDPAKETELETSLLDKYRGSTQSFLNEQLPDPKEAADKTLDFFSLPDYNPEVEGQLKSVTAEALGSGGEAVKGLWNKVFEPWVGGAARKIEEGWTGKDVDPTKYKVKQEPFLGREHFKLIVGQETKDWKDEEIATFSDISDYLFGEGKEKQKIEFNLDDFDGTKRKVDTKKVLADNTKKDASKVKAGDKSPTIGGQFTGKSSLYSLAGLSKDLGRDLDEIDSNYNTMSLIAMIGGAGSSRAAENYRRKSLQRLKFEADLGEREWQRAYKLATTALVTWYYHDPNAGVEPISLYVGQNPGPGYQQSKPSKSTSDIDWARLDAIMGEDDWNNDKYTMAIYEYINQSPGLSSMMSNYPDQAVEIASIPVLARFRKPGGGKYWTSSDVSRLRAAMKAGSKKEVMDMIKDKKEFPEGMREELDEFFATPGRPSGRFTN